MLPAGNIIYIRTKSLALVNIELSMIFILGTAIALISARIIFNHKGVIHMKIAVLGGAGQMSSLTVRDLAQSSDVKEILIADYNYEKARATAAENGPKCKAAFCDAYNVEQVRETIRGYDCVINGCTYKVNLFVMEACLKERIHYTDLGGLFYVTLEQMKLDQVFQDAGLTAVLSMGGTPGTINILARYAVERLDTVETIRVLNGCGDWSRTKEVFSVPYSIKTIMEEFTIRPVEYIDGNHIDVDPRSGLELINFPPPLGPSYAHHTIHSEPATMPAAWKEKGLKNVLFKLALPRDFHDKVTFLADIGFASQNEIEVKDGIRLKPADMLDAVIRNIPKDPDAVVIDCDILRAEVIGTKDGKAVKYTVDSIARQNERLKCSSTELNTGAPPSIVAQMIVRGDITERGAYGSERGVDPEIYFAELAKRDMYVYASMEYPVSVQSFEKIDEQKTV